MSQLSPETLAKIKSYRLSPSAFPTEIYAKLMLQLFEQYRDLSDGSVRPENHINQNLNTIAQLQQVQLRQQTTLVSQNNNMRLNGNIQQQQPQPSLIPLHGVGLNGNIKQQPQPSLIPLRGVGLNGNMVEQNYGKKRKNEVEVTGSPSAPVSLPGMFGYSVNGQLWGSTNTTNKCLDALRGPDGQLPEKLRNLAPRHIEHVSNEIMDKDPNVHWDDIAGLEHAKKCVNEMAVLPLRRPDLFMGCRSPGRGLLLFGPPGTGKTMIGKAIAGEAKATFFYISASSLTSKWVGEGEKLVRALFGVASSRQPAVIFVDEIDSLLSKQNSNSTQHEAYRLLKTQFFIEMEGFAGGNEQVLLVGATNRPQDLDEAARRRLSKRLYIPLPSSEARGSIVRRLLEKDGLFKLSDEEMDIICSITDGYSGSDMKNLVKDASMGPIREALEQGLDIMELKKEDMRLVTLQDFKNSLQEIRPSVSPNELGAYEQWNKQFGSLPI